MYDLSGKNKTTFPIVHQKQSQKFNKIHNPQRKKLKLKNKKIKNSDKGRVRPPVCPIWGAYPLFCPYF